MFSVQTSLFPLPDFAGISLCPGCAFLVVRLLVSRVLCHRGSHFCAPPCLFWSGFVHWFGEVPALSAFQLLRVVVICRCRVKPSLFRTPLSLYRLIGLRVHPGGRSLRWLCTPLVGQVLVGWLLVGFASRLAGGACGLCLGARDDPVCFRVSGHSLEFSSAVPCVLLRAEMGSPCALIGTRLYLSGARLPLWTENDLV